MKSKKLLESFVKYCTDHPELRFWQALRNWCGWAYVFVSPCDVTDPFDEGSGRAAVDTFYWEDNEMP